MQNLTQKEQLFYDQIKNLPNVKEAIARLDLVIVKSDQVLKSEKLNNRLAGWISEFKQTKPRTIIQSPSTPQPFMSNDEVKQYLELIIPTPWKFPLQHAPF